MIFLMRRVSWLGLCFESFKEASHQNGPVSLGLFSSEAQCYLGSETSSLPTHTHLHTHIYWCFFFFFFFWRKIYIGYLLVFEMVEKLYVVRFLLHSYYNLITKDYT